MMTRLCIVLLLAVMASALYLVRTQYESRRLFTELDSAQAEARGLESERQRLEVEKRAQATPSRVEHLAHERLNMRVATPDITKYITDYGTTASPGAAADNAARGDAP